MAMSPKTACIFGGTGFLGRHIVQDLARLGYRLKIVTRIPESAYFLKPYGDVGQIVPFQSSYDEEGIQKAIEGCDVVINLVGILFEKGKFKFQRVHTELPEVIAKACADKKIARFIHVSALGVDKAESKYAKSKLAGEEAVLKAYPNVTILRPSIVFGPDDGFFNMFAKMSIIAPALPLIGGGTTKFQPVFVGDIAESICNILQGKLPKGEKPEGQIYELGGPDVETFKQLLERLGEETGRKRALVSIPLPIAKVQAAFLSLAPKPLLTIDQVRSLKTDNVLSEGAKTLFDLGVEPTSMDTILPTYLACYRRGGPFGDKKSA